MKRSILTGILALATGLSGLMAQQPAQKGGQPQAAPTQPKGPSPKSKEEAAAVMALQAAVSDPDSLIKAAEDLITKFADTDYKEYALGLEAHAYQSKGDPVKAEIYAKRAMEINPNNYQMELLLGEVIGNHIGDHDLDRPDKMASATKYFNDCIENLKTAPKPNPQVSDDQWNDFKKYQTAEAHNGLGSLALLDKKWDVAISEFKLAVEGDPQDAYNTRLASAYQSSGQNAEAIAICDKLLANPQLHPRIKQVVTNIRALAAAAQNKK
ncbi:MAG TPA: hypothetical protein VLY04_07075 [Bryobacteraceae bacterium]|nr:hypothetical protein [Bryobacteraceae bacterium]